MPSLTITDLLSRAQPMAKKRWMKKETKAEKSAKATGASENREDAKSGEGRRKALYTHPRSNRKG